TKPNKLPPYTFYVTFKRDKKGRVMMTKVKRRWNGFLLAVPVEFTAHLTGPKGCGLLISQGNKGGGAFRRMVPRGPFRRTVQVTSKDLANSVFGNCMNFYIKTKGRYGLFSVGFNRNGWVLSKNGETAVVYPGLRLQEKNYDSRYLFSQ
ncbi:MAG: hypothetical protein ACP5QA_15625, partial [Phycisphaerae bacterium]